MRKACPVMRIFARKHVRAVVTTVAATVAVTATTGTSLLANYKWR
jgi:hypothetical protein